MQPGHALDNESRDDRPPRPKGPWLDIAMMETGEHRQAEAKDIVERFSRIETCIICVTP